MTVVVLPYYSVCQRKILYVAVHRISKNGRMSSFIWSHAFQSDLTHNPLSSEIYCTSHGLIHRDGTDRRQKMQWHQNFTALADCGLFRYIPRKSVSADDRPNPQFIHFSRTRGRLSADFHIVRLGCGCHRLYFPQFIAIQTWHCSFSNWICKTLILLKRHLNKIGQKWHFTTSW